MIAIISVAAMSAGIAWLASHESTSRDAYLLGGQAFSASEISAMEAAFGQAKLNTYTIEGNRLRVVPGQQAAYMAALVDHGALPAGFGDYLTAATVSVGPFTSRSQQDEIIKNAKQKELALIIRSMQGIDRAAVHYDTQKKGGLRSATITTASVSVKPLGNQPLDEAKVPMIRHLVAGAIAGLAPESVTVVDLNGRMYSGSSSTTSGGYSLSSAMDDPYLSRVKQYQAMYEATIRNALAYVPGATISVHVELDRELVHRTERETNATAREHTHVDLAALTPKLVTASVGVPSTYYEGLWQRRNASLGNSATPPLASIEKEESEKIRGHVARLLPQGPTGLPSAAPSVMVTTFSSIPFNDAPPAVAVPELMPLFTEPWALAVIAVLAISGFLIIGRRRQAQPPAFGGTPKSRVDTSRVDAARNEPRPPHVGRPVTAPSLREELAEIVRDNPEASANVLRTWIGNGS